MGAPSVARTFSLLEVAIACTLAPLVLATLLQLSTTLLTTRYHLETAHATTHAHLLIQERLGALLSSHKPSTLATPTKASLAFTTLDYLDPDPAYSGSLPITLSLQNSALTLTIGGRPETLAEGVTELTCTLVAYPSPLATLRLTLNDTTQFSFHLPAGEPL